jgi:hypothetical protein
MGKVNRCRIYPALKKRRHAGPACWSIWWTVQHFGEAMRAPASCAVKTAGSTNEVGIFEMKTPGLEEVEPLSFPVERGMNQLVHLIPHPGGQPPSAGSSSALWSRVSDSAPHGMRDFNQPS